MGKSLDCHTSGCHNFWFCRMVIRVGQLNYASQIWLEKTRVAMVAKICDFSHKIGYNLACPG